MGFYAEEELASQLFFSTVIFLAWMLIFIFFGLYRSWYASSRVDEFVTIVKAITFGILLLFLLTSDWERDLSRPPSLSRMLIISYWLLMVAGIGSGRLLLHTFQRKLLERGIGVRKAVIIGWNDKGRKLLDDILKYPALGYNVVGFVDAGTKAPQGEHAHRKVLGPLKALPDIIQSHAIEEILIALERNSRKKTVDIISLCEGLPMHIKIQPDLYDIITGQMRTNQIYGFPLIEIFPQLMPPWERKVKRIIDISVSLFILLGLLPVWILVSLLIKIDSRGPVFYKQSRVGKNSKNFNIYKFRSMIVGAEKMTGPVWAGKKDPRITRVGRLIRKLRIDEVPQFINVLDGDMSLVGPRPERPYFVEKLKRQIPLYARRLKVQPGITGWAQIKGTYDETLEDVKQKLEYDFYYVENISLRMDLKILLNTIYVVLSGKGH